MKTLLFLLLLIPQISFSNTLGYKCSYDFSTSLSDGTVVEEPIEPLFPRPDRVIHIDVVNQNLYYGIDGKEDKTTKNSYDKSDNVFQFKIDKFEFILDLNLSRLKVTGNSFNVFYNCDEINNPKVPNIITPKTIVERCIDLGFQKGTNGLKNCALLNPHNLESQKKICSEIGFTLGTEEFAQCVIDFYKQEQSQSSVNSQSDKGNSSKDIYIQNEILKEQFEYQKKRDEKEDFKPWTTGNLIDSITGSGKYKQPSHSKTCFNYGTERHPNIQCN